MTGNNPRASKIFGDDVDFGAAVRVARTIKGMTTRELSKASGMSEYFISRLENAGRDANPNYKSIKAIAEAMEITAGSMVELPDMINDLMVDLKK